VGSNPTPSATFRTELRKPGVARFTPDAEHLKQIALRAHDADLLNSHHDRLASHRRAGGGSIYRPSHIMAQLAFRDSVNGRSSSTRSCITLGVMRPRSPRSRRTRP
jgi:hypothetical protein